MLSSAAMGKTLKFPQSAFNVLSVAWRRMLTTADHASKSETFHILSRSVGLHRHCKHNLLMASHLRACKIHISFIYNNYFLYKTG